MTPDRLLLIDDHAMFRTGLRMVLAVEMPTLIVVEAGNLMDAMECTQTIDIVLLDIQLKGLNGLDGIALLKRRWPLAAVLILSAHDEPHSVNQALTRGAAGFVSKAEPAEKIIATIHHVLDGVLSDGILRNEQAPPRLTPRQCEVLDLLNQGLSNKQIARKLSLSHNTVRRHVQDILEYFQVGSRAEAVFSARSTGMLD
ncbi:MAG: response regulator transcription factor [Ferrovum sp.]|nr:response regulator transcription factor [Ferrovum sp.]NDU86563.1 response regulator transcription factor [Ferrovum sp.]